MYVGKFCKKVFHLESLDIYHIYHYWEVPNQENLRLDTPATPVSENGQKKNYWKVYTHLDGYQKKRIDLTSSEKQSLSQSDLAFSSYRRRKICVQNAL